MLKIETSGAKNISLALLPTTLITKSIIKLENLPDIVDVSIEKQINEFLCPASYTYSNELLCSGNKIDDFVVPTELGCKIRSSLYYLGALLSCVGKAVVPYPGGCNFKNRSFDIHVGALRYMGASIIVNDKNICAQKAQLTSKHIRLPLPSKGATINLIYAALRTIGVTVIENASTMPEIIELISLLQMVGFDIYVDNTNIIIYGNSDIRAPKYVFYKIPYDRLEIGTYAVLGLLLKEELKINGIDYNSMKDLITFLDNIKALYTITAQSITIHKYQNLRPTQICLGFPPALDSDYGPIITPLLCLIDGNSIIIDGHNTHRLNNLLQQLSFIGAKYRAISENIFEIKGVKQFCGNCELVGQDIRSAMGISLAALVCKGDVKVIGLRHINRAYERFLSKINNLGLSLNIS